jgi:DNA-binding Xre family transcriptional regulator
MNFLDKLDKIMREKGINKRQLARLSGVPYTTIDSFYKKGYMNMKLSTLQKLSKFSGCSMDYLGTDDEEKSNG